MQITIISTYAQDELITSKGIKTRPGGPAFFIENVFKKLGQPYEMISSQNAKVKIDLRNNRELGKILQVEKIMPLKEKQEFVIISTLAQEYELSACGKISCLDVQGYVRDPETFGKKKFFDSPELDKFTVIKGTVEELSFLKEDILNKIPVVISTKGIKGFTIATKEVKKKYCVKKIKSSDTIGSGDTFFAAFCIEYSKTADTDKSAEFAKKIVNEFLMEKLEAKK